MFPPWLQPKLGLTCNYYVTKDSCQDIHWTSGQWFLRDPIRYSNIFLSISTITTVTDDWAQLILPTPAWPPWEYSDCFIPSKDSGDLQTSYCLMEDGRSPSTPSKSRIILSESLKGEFLSLVLFDHTIIPHVNHEVLRYLIALIAFASACIAADDVAESGNDNWPTRGDSGEHHYPHHPPAPSKTQVLWGQCTFCSQHFILLTWHSFYFFDTLVGGG